MNFAFRHEARGPSVSMARPAGPLTRIKILDRLGEAEAIWRRFEEDGAIQSPYQRHDWVSLWHCHVSPHCGTTPFVAIGFDSHDHPLFLWALTRGRIGPLNVATFAGGKHATLNLPAWRADYAEHVTANELKLILAEIARAVPGLDLVLLLNQPAGWNGLRNPFTLLAHQRAAEDNFRLTLKSGPNLAAANIDSSARRRLRKKENHLARLPGYRYLRASTNGDVERCLAAFFNQKAAHLAALGLDNVFDKPGIGPFIRAACHEGLMDGRPVIELHALEGDGEILALFAGVHDRRRFTLAFNSMTRGPHSRYSPGLVLLQHVILDCASRGFEAFDIGPGDARYKTYFCKEFEQIVDSVLPLSPRGRLAAPLLRAFLFAKGRIKRSPVLWKLCLNLRRRLNGRVNRSASHAGTPESATE